MFSYMFLLFQACSINSGPVYFESGTYVLSEYYFSTLSDDSDFEDTGFVEEGDTGEENSTEGEQDTNSEPEYFSEMQNFALAVDLENLTAQITGTSFDATLTLKERPKRDWNDMCPMQLSTTDVQTVDIVGEFELWGKNYKNAFLQADECHGEPRTTTEVILEGDETTLYLTKQ